MLNTESIFHALNLIIDPDSQKGTVDQGMISGVSIKDTTVHFVLTIAAEDKDRKAYLLGACEAAIQTIAPHHKVMGVLTAEHPPTALNDHQRAHIEKGGDPARAKAVWNLTPIPHVRRIIAVASGKGGVGKSTTTVGLAHALTAAGQHVGILDADIYGPSIPRMLGDAHPPAILDNMMQPLQCHGIVYNSMGCVVGENAAILRGPMITKALQQLLRLTAWGTSATPLDVLLIDMPPGTGDVHLSLAQQCKIDGAIIVTTPQIIATIDAKKCAQTFVKLGVPLIGVIENMSYFIDPSGTSHALFGEGGGVTLATEIKAPFLGRVPLDPSIRAASDQGKSYDSILWNDIIARCF